LSSLNFCFPKKSHQKGNNPILLRAGCVHDEYRTAVCRPYRLKRRQKSFFKFPKFYLIFGNYML